VAWKSLWTFREREGVRGPGRVSHLQERDRQHARQSGLFVKFGDLVIESFGEVEVLVDTVTGLVHEPEVEHRVGVPHVGGHLVVQSCVLLVGEQATQAVVVHVADLKVKRTSQSGQPSTVPTFRYPSAFPRTALWR
jgi:hypothetical protein